MERTAATKKSVMGGLTVVLPLGVILAAIMGIGGLILGLCIGGVWTVAMFWLLKWYFATHKINKRLGPSCPTCGKNVGYIYMSHAKRSGKGTSSIPNYLQCPYCGYHGVRAPYDGLWRFVDAYGPEALSGTSAATMAQHSYQARHGKR